MVWYDVNDRLPSRELEMYRKMHRGENAVPVLCAVDKAKEPWAIKSNQAELLLWDGEEFRCYHGNRYPVTHWMPISALPDDKTNLYGLWNVYSVGDEVCHIVTYVGYADDIAFALSDKQGYCLQFRRAFGHLLPSAEDKLDVVVDFGLGKDLDKYKTALCGSGVTVTDANGYNAVELHREDPKAKARAAALAKLTPEEREALGV